MIELIVSAILLGIFMSGVYACMSIGLTLCFGVMKVANAAQAAFAILASYIAYWFYVYFGVDPLLCIPIIMAIMFPLGLVTFRLTLSKIAKTGQTILTFLITFSLQIILENTITLLWKAEYRSLITWYSKLSIYCFGTPIPVSLVLAFPISIGVIALLSAFLKFTRLGKAFRATSIDATAASLMGVNVDQIYMLTFGLSVAFGGIAGVLLALIYPFYPNLQSVWIGLLFVVVMFGGMGSIAGTLVASVFIATVQSVTQILLAPVWAQVILYFILIITLIVKPEGLLGGRHA